MTSQHWTRRSILRSTGATGFGLLPATGIGQGSSDTNSGDRPYTIPAIQRWYSRSGEFNLRESGRLLLSPGQDSSALTDEASLFAEDLEALTGAEYTVETSDVKDRTGDIRLTLDNTDSTLPREGYDLKIGDTIDLTAPTPAGVFYGTRTILQLLAQELTIPTGWARDWPRYPERGLMVDTARGHFTFEWLEAHIRELAYLKQNYFHLHFTDDEGWRIESDQYPEIVSDEHLTKDEVRELVALANRHHITAVPEIDMPTHMGAALEPYPEYQLKNATGRTDDQQTRLKLDITNPEALAFARDLIEEYIQLFSGPYFHIGVDEWIAPGQREFYPQLETYAQEHYDADANAHDALLGFVNWAHEIVKGHGKQTRMWHDELTGGNVLRADPDIITEWWTDYGPISSHFECPDPQELLDRGHRIHNAGWYPTYVTELGAGNFGRTDVETAYESWHVHQFHGGSELFWNSPTYGFTERRDVPYPVPPTHMPPPKTVAPTEERNLGSKINLWGGTSWASEDELADILFPKLRMLAQKAWESPRLTEQYDAFKPIMRAVGNAPRTGEQVGTLEDSQSPSDVGEGKRPA